MSIIHNALKKVQQTMNGNAEKPEDAIEHLSLQEIPVTSIPPTNVENLKRPFPSWPIVLLSLAVIGFSCVFGLMQVKAINPQLPSSIHIQLPFKMPIKSPSLSIKTDPAPVPQENIVPSPLTPSARPAFQIQGVMAEGTRNVALINNKIYEEGSLVDGAKIIQISLTAVTIEKEGKQEILNVSK